MFYKTPLLLAVFADQKNVYPDKFDDVSIFSNGVSHFYLDKLSLRGQAVGDFIYVNKWLSYNLPVCWRLSAVTGSRAFGSYKVCVLRIDESGNIAII